ncbi:MAG: LptF/LptG family permease [Candidatus Binatia bacterium]
MLRLFSFLRTVHERFLSSLGLGEILSSYVMREIAMPTILSLAGLSLLVLTKDLLNLTDFIINRGFGVLVIATIAFYELVPLAARTLPFAVLIGTLVGLGRLRADCETVALESAGLSKRRLAGPVLAFAIVMMTVGLLLSLFVAPWATRSLDSSLQRLAVENPGLSLRPGTVHEFGGVKLVARKVSARGDRLHGVLLWIPHSGQTLFAERGEMLPQDSRAVQLVLHDGVMLRTPRVRGEETRFESFFQTLPTDAEKVLRTEKSLEANPLDTLVKLAWQETGDEALARKAQSEFHRRLAYPAASLCFGVLAVSLALMGHGFSRSVGGVAGLLVTLLYYGLMQLGDGLVQGGSVRVSTGVWLPNLVIGVMAVGLLSWENLWPWWSAMTSRWRLSTRKLGEPRSHSLPFQRYFLEQYVARHYLVMVLLSFMLLLVGYLLVDILERLQWFARYHTGALKTFQFYSLRLPLLASRVTPMSLLLATTLTVSLLSAHREIIGMRACGVSVIRALSPILFIAGLVAQAYFVLNEVVVPKTNALADQFKEREIKNREQNTGPLSEMVWYQAGSRVYQAKELDPRLGWAKELSIYNLGAQGLPVERVDAREARYIGKGVWELLDPSRIEISENGFRETPAETRVQLGEAPTEALDTMRLGVRELAHQIHEAEANGYDATTYRVDFHVKLAAPLACLLLPAIALFFAVSGPPFPGPALTVLVSIAIGIGQVLLTGVCASLGYGGFLPPSLAGWTPSLALAILAGLLSRHSYG